MKKAIIFDMDGLMIDSERLYFQVEREIVENYGKIFREDVLWKMMGRKPIESIKLFVEEFDLPEAPEKILALRNTMMREKLKNDLLPMPGLENIINAFYGEKKLAVATGAQQEFLDIVIDRLRVRDRFAVLLSSDSIKNGKPHPEMYLKACEKLNLDPAQCIVLEDSSNGALAGKRAGCYVIAVPSEYTKDQDFSFVDFTARDLFQAKDHITDKLL